ncbi:glucose PTS transporter subunit EIIB [Fusibacter bizertensis]|uniref:Glucose PTS transporter subunit EIIB n=1 Tax=Fusibacter bizertensis TaxID=1488331 RepID=A0ABT6NGX3_9FIRM|nr:glucose PTS transporter subunit EIIB [Fusibacter bizertensis]MDH8679683.1 glucose PTS transporter subunit EIIB [Fusibacter bizertensis]
MIHAFFSTLQVAGYEIHLNRIEKVTEEGETVVGKIGISEVARGYYHAIGGKENIVEVDSCITRLRLTLKDASIVDEAACKRLGAAGLIKPNNKNVQIVVGTHAELIAEEIKKFK